MNLNETEYLEFSNNVSVAGRLNKCLDFWKLINANQYILDIIEHGYKIPFKTLPLSDHLKNNKSSLDHPKFVETAILDLVKCGAVIQSTNKPYVINPLTVAQNTNKLRLVLDLRHINKRIDLDKIKFEDWKVALQLVKQGDFLFSFDLKSGYHHIGIHKEHQKFLGFSWNFDGHIKYFYFIVLPFGLASAGHIFTKTIKCLVKHWRSHSINIIVYLDDGLGIAESLSVALNIGDRVREDILRSGFIVNARNLFGNQHKS